MLHQNIRKLTSRVLQNSPYSFNILWSKGPYMLVEMKPKHPKINMKGQIIDMMESQDPCVYGKVK